MAQNIKIGVASDTSGATKGVEQLDRATEGLVGTLNTVERAADAVDKKLEKVLNTAKKVGDASAKIAELQKTLGKALGAKISEPDARRFSENFEKVRTGGGFGSQRVRDFDDFGSWYNGHSSTFRSPQSAASHRSRIIARGMQGTEWANNNAPPPAPPPPPGNGRGFNHPAVARAGSSALGVGAKLLGIAGIATTISGIMGMVGQGVGYAADEGGTLDTLKRRFGGNGMSYRFLQQGTRGAAAGLGISYTDSAQYASTYAGAAGRGGDDIGSSLRIAYGTSRGLGVDPGQGAEFFGSMSKLGVAKDDAGQRRLAALIADGIERGGFTAKADEVLRAVADYAGTAFRASLSTPNVGAYLSGLTSMTSHVPGLDPAGAASIIGQANSAMTQGGAVGEASKNLAYAALAPGYGPAIAEGLWAGGVFGTPDSVFGTAGNRTMMGQWADSTGQGTPTGSMSNLHGIRQMLSKQTAGMGRADGAMVRAKSIQGFFGLNSIQDALALDQMDENPEQLGGTQKLLSSVGVDMSRMTNFSGIADIAKLSGAKSLGDMWGTYQDVLGRSDVGQAQKDSLRGLYNSGDIDETRKTLAKILAIQGQAATPGSETRVALSDLKDTLTDVGGKLLDPLDKIREAVVGMYSLVAPQEYKDKQQAERDSRTDFAQRVRDGDNGDERLGNIYRQADSEYSDAASRSGGKPVDINRLAPEPAGSDGNAWYDARQARRQHLLARYDADYGAAAKQKAMTYFRSVGWSDEAAAGLTANGMDESGLAPHGPDGDGGAAVGAFQWHPDRQAAIEAHFHKSIRDMDLGEQLRAKNWELQPGGPEERAGNALRHAKNAYDAGEIDSRLDQRPGLTQEDKDRAAFRRGNLADGISKNTPLPAGDPNGTSDRQSSDVRVHGSADIIIRDSSGKQIGTATAPMTQMPKAPSPAGVSGSW